MGKLPAGSPTKNHHVLSIEDNSVHALEARRKVRKKSSGRFQDAGKTGSRVGTPPPTTNRGSHRILAGEEKSSEHSCFAGFLLAEDRGFELPPAYLHTNTCSCLGQCFAAFKPMFVGAYKTHVSWIPKFPAHESAHGPPRRAFPSRINLPVGPIPWDFGVWERSEGGCGSSNPRSLGGDGSLRIQIRESLSSCG